MQVYCIPAKRRIGIGKQLVQELVDYAEDREYLSLTARVASDLDEANAFYERMGFNIVKTIPGGQTRNRLIYYRVRDLDTPSLFDFMTPTAQAPMHGFGISGQYSNRTPIYAIDLNVLFDVSKQRINSKEAGIVFRAGFRNEIRPVIAEEFVIELQRNSDKFHDDPHLRLALQMDILPTPKPEKIRSIEENLAAAIFPERNSQGILTPQDKSDLRHLATAAHYNISGFVTSEKAILRARDQLYSDYRAPLKIPTRNFDRVGTRYQDIWIRGM